MLKLIIGVKGTGKTKTLINMVNSAVETSTGDVVCIEKGVKLRYDVKYQARLINTEEFFITDAQSLYGFVAGIFASNHDVTDLFIDSAYKICKDNAADFDVFVEEIGKLSDKVGVNVVATASIPVEDASETVKKFI
jgi:hypothetical protein